MRVHAAEQLWFRLAVSEGDEAEHAPFHPAGIGRDALARDQVDDTVSLCADPHDGP